MLIIAANLRCTAPEVYMSLLKSLYLQDCIDPIEAVKILSSSDLWGDSDCIRIFSHHFQKNVCVHFELEMTKSERVRKKKFAEIINNCHFEQVSTCNPPQSIPSQPLINIHKLSRNTDNVHIDNINFSQEKLPVFDNDNCNHDVNSVNTNNKISQLMNYYSLM